MILCSVSLTMRRQATSRVHCHVLFGDVLSIFSTACRWYFVRFDIVAIFSNVNLPRTHFIVQSVRRNKIDFSTIKAAVASCPHPGMHDADVTVIKEIQCNGEGWLNWHAVQTLSVWHASSVSVLHCWHVASMLYRQVQRDVWTALGIGKFNGLSPDTCMQLQNCS